MRNLHSTIKAAGLLNAPITDGDGQPTVLGDLVVARGNDLKPAAVAS
jgi:hypothetical protein